MRLYFEHIEVRGSHLRCMFTVSVLPEEMGKFKDFISQYSEGENKGYFSIEEAIKKAEKELTPRRGG